MATPGAIQPQVRNIVSQGGMVAGGVISFSQAIFFVAELCVAWKEASRLVRQGYAF
jgi:hypothetical protein